MAMVLVVLVPVVHGASSTDTFQVVGNGFCINSAGKRLKLGPNHHMHAHDLQWKATMVSPKGRARHCETLCLQADNCIGYMTEDGRACDIIRRSDHNAAHGIAGADDERRNFCWERVASVVKDSASKCEVTVSWPDGRPDETRECFDLAL